MIKVIIFDYYGVIAQDAFWYEVKGIEKLHHKSPHIQKLSNEVNLNHISWLEFCEAVSKDIGESVEEVLKRYEQHKIKPGIVELIHALSQKYRTVLLSNASSDQLVPVMQRLGLDKLFEKLFISSDIGILKPDKESFLYVIKELEVEPSECLLIDDSEDNVESAKNLGLQGIVFKGVEDCTEQLHHILTR